MSEKQENSHSGHRQRMRDRFIAEGGLDSFQDHNTLELLLFYAIPRADTNELAHRLINTFGSLKGVFDAPYEALLNIDGIGEKAAVLIRLIHSLTREYIKSDIADIKTINSTKDAVEYFKPKFACMRNESLLMVCLNNSGRILKFSVISEGGIDHTEMNIRKIMSDVLNCHATAVVLAHNHPGGLCVPSKADHESTFNISSVLSSVNIRLLNHIIISGDEYFSFFDNPKFADCFNFGSKTIKYAYEPNTDEKNESGENNL